MWAQSILKWKHNYVHGQEYSFASHEHEFKLRISKTGRSKSYCTDQWPPGCKLWRVQSDCNWKLMYLTVTAQWDTNFSFLKSVSKTLNGLIGSRELLTLLPLQLHWSDTWPEYLIETKSYILDVNKKSSIKLHTFACGCFFFKQQDVAALRWD